MDDGIAGISRRVKHFQTGMALHRLIGELAAGHPAGQGDIGKQQPHLGMRFEQREPLHSGRGREHVVAKLAQEIGREDADISIVFHEEDHLAAAAPRPRRFGQPDCLHIPEMARQVEPHRRALTGLAIDRAMPARLLDKAIDLRQPEPGALPGLLGREKGLERLLAHLGAHAAASVADRDHHILPRRQLLMSGGVGLVEQGVCGLDCQLSPAGHRVPRVDRQIEERMLELVGVYQHRPQTAGQHGLGLDLLAQSAAQEIRHPGDQPVDLERFRVERLAAREGQEPLGQRRGPIDPAHRRAGEPQQFGIAVAHAALQQLDISRDGGQQIVEVMRDAGGQLTERLHLLGLTQLRFGGLALRHCFPRLRDGFALAPGVAQRDQAQQDEADCRGHPEIKVRKHNVGPFAQDRGAGPADRHVDRIAVEPLIGDHLDDAVEGRRLHPHAALRLLRRRPYQDPGRRRPRAAPDNLRIARQRRAIGAKDAGGVVDIVGKQLCIKAAEEIRRDGDDNDTLELAGGSDPASRHGKKRLVVEARLQAADVNLRAGLAQRAEIVAVRQVEAAAREVAGAD